jgi:hypothetical protein
MMQQYQQQQLAKNTPPGVAMTQQRYGDNYDGHMQAAQASDPERFYQAVTQTAVAHDTRDGHLIHHGPTDEQRKIAMAMGAAGLQSIVHNGKVIKDYMAVPFTQRWRKRPYGFTNTPVQRQQPSA